MNEEAFNSQLDSLNIKHKIFYTKVIFRNLNEVNNYRVNCYFTDIFNDGRYTSTISKTYGIYYPTVWPNTKNIVGLTILLVHTDDALYLANSDFASITKETKISAISQNLPVRLTDEIANILSEKYGNPLDTIKSELISFCLSG